MLSSCEIIRNIMLFYNLKLNEVGLLYIFNAVKKVKNIICEGYIEREIMSLKDLHQLNIQ